MAWGEDIDEVQEDYEVMSSEESDNQPQYQSDDDSDTEYYHGAGTTSEKRRVQNEIFRTFAARKTEEITEKEVKEAIAGSKDEELSIRAILAKQENSARITNPRDYQTELFQRAKEQNIIAVLDTGTGKTHIATLLLRHILDQELEARAKGDPPKIAFFLVGALLRCHTPY
jgi:endoribonuclease Dicer